MIARKNIFERALKSLIPEKREGQSYSAAFPFLQSISGNGKISKSKALTLPAFYNGIDQITNDLAKLPKSVYEKTDSGRQKLSEHRVTFLIDKEPNDNMTAFTFWKMMIQSAILTGNGIAVIHKNKRTSQIESLEFIHPDEIRDIRKVEGKLYYFLGSEIYHSPDVIHILGFSDDGLKGKGIITYAATILNISIDAQQFTSDGFKNRGLGFAALETEKQVNADTKRKIEDSVNKKLNASGSIKSVVLDEGFSYKPISINNQEAQLIEQGKFSINDIARFLNISPHKLKVSENMNYASLNLMNIEHVSDSIQPWMVKVQQECNRKLFFPNEKSTHYVKFNDNILLRADLQSKSIFYTSMAYAGVMTRNEIRAMEEMNSIDGLDEPLTPVNQQLMEEVQEKIKNMKNNE